MTRVPDPELERLPCHYPLIHRSNKEPVHFLHGFTEYPGERLGVWIAPPAFRGDIHLTKDEKEEEEEPLVHRLTGDAGPCSGSESESESGSGAAGPAGPHSVPDRASVLVKD